ncbi:dihydrofolate reductase family protein [Puia sp.]|jgi:dihydrofolate reductase|uniref:dihydrofolate reductase family protein n=1 Tax=Puia sp. TaxID=2045100 RepID=UPI002F4256BD
MRKLIYAINLTLDGCFDHTKAIPSEELHEYFTNLIRDSDLLVYGRVTYELMVPFWPDIAKKQSMSKVSNEFATTFDSVAKVVFSKSLETSDPNTRIVRTDLKEEILRLKQQQGKNMLLGGVSLPSKLIKLDLVDEFYFVIHPVIAGGGRRLMEGIAMPESLQLQLVDSKTIKPGHVAHHYVKRTL